MTLFLWEVDTVLQFRDLVFVGIDPHKEEHVAVMIDHWGEVFFELAFPNQPSGFKMLLEHVNAHAPDGKTAVFGIEDTGGLGRSCAQWLTLQDRLVKGINPIMSRDKRRRHPHCSKNDVIDAVAVAKVLITEFDLLPKVTADDYYYALRQLANRRDQLVRTRTRCKNQLHKVLHDNYPEYKEFFSDPFGATALAFWSKYPHPNLLKGVGPKRLASFLSKIAKNMSSSKAELILSMVDKQQVLTIDAKMNIIVIRQIIEQLRQIDGHIAEMEQLMAEALEQSDTQLETMPGVGTVTAISILARVGPSERFSSADKLARHAGIAPVDDSSGRTRKQQRSKSGDRQLNAAIHRVALNQISVSRNGVPKCPVAYHYYQRKISEGKSKLSALTCLKRRLCDIIYAMLRDKTHYVPCPSTSLKLTGLVA
jgi:transposase